MSVRFDSKSLSHREEVVDSGSKVVLDVPYPDDLRMIAAQIDEKFPGARTEICDAAPCVVVVRKATKKEHQNYLAAAMGEDKNAPIEVAKKLAHTCLLWPVPEAFGRMIDECPGLETEVGLAAIVAASNSKENLLKKARSGT